VFQHQLIADRTANILEFYVSMFAGASQYLVSHVVSKAISAGAEAL
jgi:hypothetical protein